MMMLSSVMFAGTAFAQATDQQAQTTNNQQYGSVEPNGTWVGGFYPDWSYWRGGSGVAKLNMVQGEQPNFITYAFLSIKNSQDTANQQSYGGVTYGRAGIPYLDNGTVYNLDDKAEPRVNKEIRDYLTNYASEHNIPLLASIGGWSFASQFEQMFLDAKAASRSGEIQASNPIVQRFIRTTLSYIRQNNLDGVNIDWEYPGYLRGEFLGEKRAQEEGHFFKLLIDQLEAKFGDKYILSVAVWANKDTDKLSSNGSIDWGHIAEQVNWIDLMAFDVHGEFDASDEDGVAASMSPIDYLKKSLDFYIKDQGVPSNKILLGIPAYAREMLINEKPTQANNYGDQASLRYSNVDDVFDAFKDRYYDNPGNYAYAYNANPDAFNPAGGMVDFTGVYSYTCFLEQVSGGKVSNNCPMGGTNLDKRGNAGTPLPSNLQLTHLDHDGDMQGWMYSQQKDVQQLFAGSPDAYYDAYPVFSFDTPTTVESKIKELVKKYDLGGVWFWTFTQDALTKSSQNAKYSLFHAAYQALHDGSALHWPGQNSVQIDQRKASEVKGHFDNNAYLSANQNDSVTYKCQLSDTSAATCNISGDHFTVSNLNQTSDQDAKVQIQATNGDDTISSNQVALFGAKPEAWDQNTTYQEGQLVSYKGHVYYCTVNNKGLKPSDHGEWLQANIEQIAPWQASTDYHKGDVAYKTHDGEKTYYIALFDQSNNDPEGGAIGRLAWSKVQFSDLTTFEK